MKKIVIVGGAGFVGSYLSKTLKDKGYEVLILEKNDVIEKSKFENVYAVINLAGAPISKKWTKEYKELIRKSRIETTINIVEAINFENGPKILVNASAVGIYGDDFLAGVCRDWENEAFKAKEKGVRVVAIRTAHVLGNGGILKELKPLFKLGIGGYFADGSQYMPWIHIDDLVNIYIFAIENSSVQGSIDVACGEPITQKIFMKSVAKKFNSLWTLSIPKFLAKIVKGEMADIFFFGQKVKSEEIKKLGFIYKYEDINIALADIVV